MLEPKAFRYAVKKLVSFSNGLGTGVKIWKEMRDVSAVAGDWNYADLIMRDREIKGENRLGIFSRGVKVMSDLEHAEFKGNMEIPHKASKKSEPELSSQDLYNRI